MNCIHKNEVNKIAEWNLLNDILNPLKWTKKLDRDDSPITYVCMNTWKGRGKFKNFRILLDIGCSSTIVMISLTEKNNPKKGAVIQWHTQSSNITANLKIKIYLNLPELITTNITTCICHVYDSTKCIYDMILGRYILTELWLILKFSEHIIESYYVPFKGSTAYMVDLGKY